MEPKREGNLKISKVKFFPISVQVLLHLAKENHKEKQSLKFTEE